MTRPDARISRSNAPAPSLASVPPLGRLARRSLFLGLPVLGLAACSGFGDSGEDPATTSEEAAQNEEAAPAEGAAILEIPSTLIDDPRDVGALITPIDSPAAVRAPHAETTVTAAAVLTELEPELYETLTGEPVPLADDDPAESASVIIPPEGKAFLVSAWESTDAPWQPELSSPVSAEGLVIIGGNEDMTLFRASSSEPEHSGAVLLTIDAEASPEDLLLRLRHDDGDQDLSLLDGTRVATCAPRMYAGDFAARVSDAEEFEATVSDGFAEDEREVRGTVESAYLTSYIKAGPQSGGNLGWAREDEMYVMVQLDWGMTTYSANLHDLSKALLILPDGTEITPEQEPRETFDHHAEKLLTFVVPARTETATVQITPYFEKSLDKDFKEEHDPVTAALTFS